MDDISNRTVALLLVAAIVVSLGATVFTLSKLDRLTVTGRATDTGNVSLIVDTDESFILTYDVLDFGTGSVNATRGCNNATLFASIDYNDSQGRDCWNHRTAAPAQPTSGFQMYNDGNINLTITVTGPNTSAFFDGWAGTPLNLTWKARDNESGSCPNLLDETWGDFQKHSQEVCGDLLYGDSTNSIGVDVMVVIDNDLPAASYSNASIEFTGSQS